MLFFTSETSTFTECGLRHTHFWVLTLDDNCVCEGMKGRYFRIVEDKSKINCEVLRFSSFTTVDTNNRQKLSSSRKIQQSYEEEPLKGDFSIPKIEATGSSETFTTLCQIAPCHPKRQ